MGNATLFRVVAYLTVILGVLSSCWTTVYAQVDSESLERLVDCTRWSPFDDDEIRDIERIITVDSITFHTPVRGHIDISSGKGSRAGVFVMAPTVKSLQLALWRSLKDGDTAFTTESGKYLIFVPDDSPKKKLSVTFGWFDRKPVGVSEEVPVSIRCGKVKIIGPTSGEIVISLGRVGKGSGRDGAPPDVPEGGSITDTLKSLKDGKPVEAPDSPIADKLASVVKKNKISEPKDADEGPAKKGDVDGGSPTPMVVSSTEGIVCRSDDLNPLDVKLNSRVGYSSVGIGLRNQKQEAGVFDFVRVADSIVPKQLNVDISDSVGSTVIFNQVHYLSSINVSGEAREIFPVRFPGLDSREMVEADSAVSATAVDLNVVVIGGAEELAISGLDEVDKNLKTLSGGTTSTRVLWYRVVDNDLSANPEEFSSLSELVEAAGALANGEKFAVLDGEQFLKLVDKIALAVSSSEKKVDQVLWLKGAFRLYSSAPSAIERFLNQIGRQGVVTVGPSGSPVQWLTIVTARMPGFSVAYLKEPVSVANAGTVIDEPAEEQSPRRLIAEPKGVATTLQGIADLHRKEDGSSTPASVEDANRISDQVVVDGYDVFSEWGYALTLEALEDLSDRSGQLSKLWNKDSGTKIRANAILSLQKRYGSDATSMANVLSSELLDGLEMRYWEEWMSKEFNSLSEEESRDARRFVQRLSRRIGSISEELKSRDMPGRCKLLYISAGGLGVN